MREERALKHRKRKRKRKKVVEKNKGKKRVLQTKKSVEKRSEKKNKKSKLFCNNCHQENVFYNSLKRRMKSGKENVLFQREKTIIEKISKKFEKPKKKRK